MTTANKIVSVDLVERAKGLLLSQFKDKEIINKIVEALMEQVQELDDALIDLQQVRMLDTAYGIYLDQIGEKLKVPRTMFDDNDYRTAIKVRMLKNRSQGSIHDIEEIISLFTYGQPFFIENTHPYVIELSAYLACLNTPEALQQLNSLFPMGIAVRIQSCTSSPFGFAGNPNASGFSSISGELIGGQISSLVSSHFGVSQDSRFVVRKQELPEPVDPNIPTTATKPVLMSPPLITPTSSVYEGTTLTCSNGTWESVTTLSYTYQWFRNGESISGADGTTHTVVAADIDKVVTCRVTALNEAGQTAVVAEGVTPIEDVTTDTGVIANLNLASAYNSASVEPSPCVFIITFKSDGTFALSGSSFSETSQFLVTTGTGAANNYDIQYINTDGEPLSVPAQNVWQNLSSDRPFSMTVNRAARDRGGEQLFRLRNNTTGLITEGSTYISVSVTTTGIEP